MRRLAIQTLITLCALLADVESETADLYDGRQVIEIRMVIE